MVRDSGTPPPGETGSVFNEMGDPHSGIRPPYVQYASWLSGWTEAALRQKQVEAELLFQRLGITFSVYGKESGTERLIPFDILPRILGAEEWSVVSRGCIQRVRAVNLFLKDLYHEQEILRAGILPREAILANSQFLPVMKGVPVPGDVYVHIAGIDIVRVREGEFYVLEDNLRTPSGVSYMLENRRMMMRLFPDLFTTHMIAPVDHYPQLLLNNLRSLAARGDADPVIVLLTPGVYNSAYFEHAFLAQQMGVELVEGQDLFVRDRTVYMRTTQGPRKVDVIYRRIDDAFLDPQVFRDRKSVV